MLLPEGVKVSDGTGSTVTEHWAIAVHVPLPPITEYTVAADGDATTAAPEVLLNPEEGDQVYVGMPLAVSVNDDPAHTVACGTRPIVGEAITLTVATIVLVQAPVPPVTV